MPANEAKDFCDRVRPFLARELPIGDRIDRSCGHLSRHMMQGTCRCVLADCCKPRTLPVCTNSAHVALARGHSHFHETFWNEENHRLRTLTDQPDEMTICVHHDCGAGPSAAWARYMAVTDAAPPVAADK